MVQYVITPWRHQSELLAVREALYGEGREVMAEGVERVGVWMQRGNCPHLVESTALLAAAVLNDERGGNSNYCVRAAYGGAFCRFVTGLLDGHQVKQKKMSMYSIAKSIGLPATYVELRHQATHEELPSLSKLRTATQKALTWIWEYYWVNLTVHEDEKEDLRGVNECRAFVRRVVGEGDDGRRIELENHLSKWEEDELLMAITEVQWTEKDAKVLLRCLELHRKISNRGVASSVSPGRPIKVGNLDNFRKEMASMAQSLEDAEDNFRSESQVEDKDVETEEGKGWALWEGPWVPKPIGVV